MYSFETVIRFSQCDNNLNLSLSGLLNLFQDSCIEQSEVLGIGFDYLIPKKLGWMLATYNIKIFNLPKLGDKITVNTMPYKIKGFLGFRAFELVGADGLLAVADTSWILMDIEKYVPARADEVLINGYGVDSKPDIEYRDSKLKPSDNLEVIGDFTVMAMTIDSNHHMNNAYYITIADKYLPEGFVPSEITINYKDSALLGDELLVKRASIESGYQIVFEGKKVCAIIEFVER